MEKKDEKDLKRFVPIEGCKNKPFQMDYYGNFRIVMNSDKGKVDSGWVVYQGIAVINIGAHLFIGVSDYYKGYMPTERVLKIEEVDEDGESDFYKFKIVDLVEDRILDPESIDKLLRDLPTFDVEEYEFIVKPASQKDFVKIRIIQLGNYDDQDRFLSKEEVLDYMIETFTAGDFDVYDENDNLINI